MTQTSAQELHLQLSKNEATGESLNLDPRLTCDKRCEYCYALKRTKEEAKAACVRLGLAPGCITGNTGPITWDLQQAVYKRNTEYLMSLDEKGVRHEAALVAKHLHRSRVSHDNLRFFGCGDAFLQAVQLAFYLGCEGCQAWGFSKKPLFIGMLASWAREFAHVKGFVRPHFLLSCDRWTTPSEIEARIAAGARLNGCTKVLAYMALKDETPESIRQKPFWKYVRTVLGYHATMVHTTVGISRECPKTSQKGVTCQQCQRCMNARRG